MARLKYNPDRDTIRFQAQGRGLLASVTELQRATVRTTEAQERQRLQAAKQAELQISGLAKKAEFEEKNINRLHKLEDDVRKHNYEAFKTFAESDVDRLEGEWKEDKKYADFMAEFAPKANKVFLDAFWKGAKALDNYQAIRAQEKWDKDPRSTDQAIEHYKTHVLLKVANTKDLSGLNDQSHLNAAELTGGTNSLNQGSIVWGNFTDNKSTYFKGAEAQIQEMLKGQSGGTLGVTKYNALELYEFSGRLFLHSRNINANSHYGKKILTAFRSQGRLVAAGKKDNNDVELSKQTINKQIDIVNGVKSEGTFTHEGVTYSNVNTEFNKGVILSSGSTRQIGNDIIRLTPNENLGEGFEYWLTDYLTRNWDKFEGREESINEWLATLYIPDKNSPNGLGKTSWYDKFKGTDRIENALKKWRTELKRQTTILEEKGDLEAGQYLTDTNAKIDEIKKNNGGVLPNEDRLNIINSISKTKFKDTKKQELYDLVNFDASGFDSGSVYVAAIRAFNDSREGDFLQALGQMNEAARKRLANEIELLNVIQKGQAPQLSGSTQVTGMKAVNQRATSGIQSISQGYTISGPSLTTSGKQISNVYKQLFMNELDLNLDGEGTAKQKVLNAWTAVDDKYLKTASPLEPIPGQPGQYRLIKGSEKPGAFLGNPLNFIPASGGEAGLTKPGVEFPFATDPDQNIANSLHDLYVNTGKTEEGTWIDTNDKLPDVQIIEYSDHTLLSRRFDDIIKGERLVSPHTHNQFVAELDKVAQNPSLTLDLAAIMPERLRFLADKSGIPYDVVVNSYFAARGMSHRVSADLTSAALIREAPPSSEGKRQYEIDTIKQKKPLPWNMEGQNFFATVQAQGSYCMEPTVFNEMVNGLDRLDSFTHKFEIKTYTDEGNGKIIISDVPKFFNEGGAQQLTSELAWNMGLLSWDDSQGWVPGVNMLSSYKKDLARLLRNKPGTTGGVLSQQLDPKIRSWQSDVRTLKNKIKQLEKEGSTTFPVVKEKENDK